MEDIVCDDGFFEETHTSEKHVKYGLSYRQITIKAEFSFILEWWGCIQLIVKLLQKAA